jgi:hypothetical protein
LPDETVVAVTGRRSGYQDFKLYRLIALGRTQNSVERKEGFGFVHRQLLTVEEPPKVADFGGWAQGKNRPHFAPLARVECSSEHVGKTGISGKA